MKNSDPSTHTLDDLRAGTKKSLNAALIERLRSDLIKGVIEPGSKLKIPDICERYDVSPGVSREALSRLVPEGLIDFTDQRGFRTPPLSARMIRDITRARFVIEREALIDAMNHGTADWEAEIIAAEHRLQACERKIGDGNIGEDDEWALLHKQFHYALLSACSSNWLIRLHDMLYHQTERYRHIAAKGGNSATGRRRNTASEHSQIAEAAINRDKREVIRLMEQHLNRTAERAIAAANLAED